MADKKIDEEWKKQAREEKEKIGQEAEESPMGPPPDPSFSMIISSFIAQSLMALGEMESPIDGQRTQDLASAKFTIDLLQVMQDKTQGNLDDDEKKMLDSALYDLRMRYVRASS